MNWILTPLEVRPDHRNRIGPKAYALSLLAREGFNIPDTLFLTVDGYNEFVDAAGIRERILLELNRKKFKDMRWEEIWDCATRIRHIFLKKQITGPLQSYLTEKIQSHFSEKTLAIRSSAPDEDDSGSSFAGLHESFVNVRGTSSILDHILLVWASLWSDAALLYRQEIGLDVEKSAMAVVLQETVTGRRSGVVFSQNPNDETQVMIESVFGLNQGLVDGIIEPDRWILDRDKKTVLSHKPAQRKHWMIPSEHGVKMASLPEDLAGVVMRCLAKLPGEIRLAVEMATQEEAERRAMEGELDILEEAWRQAEEIAGIADNLLVPQSVEEFLRQEKRKAGLDDGDDHDD